MELFISNLSDSMNAKCDLELNDPLKGFLIKMYSAISYNLSKALRTQKL